MNGVVRFFRSAWGGLERPQPSMVFQENGEIIDDTLDVFVGYSTKEEQELAWGVDTTNQVIDKKLGYMQVYSERELKPISLWVNNDTKWPNSLLLTLMQSADDWARTKIAKKAQGQRMFWIILAIVLALATILLLTVVGNLHASGRLF